MSTDPADPADDAFAAAARLALPPGDAGPGEDGADTGTGTATATAGAGPLVAWSDLVAFARWTEATYGPGLLACWPLHPDVLQELAALLAARDDAEAKSGRALADWHSLLAVTGPRIVTALQACSSSHHEPPAHRRLEPASLLLPDAAAGGVTVPINWRAWRSQYGRSVISGGESQVSQRKGLRAIPCP